MQEFDDGRFAWLGADTLATLRATGAGNYLLVLRKTDGTAAEIRLSVWETQRLGEWLMVNIEKDLQERYGDAGK